MTIEDALNQLGRQIGLELRLDAAGACRLVFDGRTTVDIEAPAGREGTVFLHSAVGLLPPSGAREAVYEDLLSSNLFGRDTGRAVLAIDGDLGEIVLFRQLDLAGTGYAAFADAIEDFVARTRAWTGRLQQARSTSAIADIDGTGAYGIRV